MDHHHSTRLSRGPAGGSASLFDHPAPTATAAGPGPSAPPIHRSSMVATPWRGFVAGAVDALRGRHRAAHVADRPLLAWEEAAVRRRRVLLALIASSAVGATALVAHVLPPFDSPALRMAQIGLFGFLFAWVAAGFFTALMGFWVQLRGDPHALSAKSVANDPIDAAARTAIIMPICNEQVSTVFAGLRATCESLVATEKADLFDLYVLSDTSDPALRAAELAAWADLRETMASAGPKAPRIFYRWRQRHTKRKSGNVADFCRRWGRNYRYMIVFDADSVMSGDCMTTLVRLMEANPTAGIIQTAPQASGLTTVHARAQQFAGRVAGRLFSAGMQYWQLGESHYWGHNAIIRVAPFIAHCALAPLAGRGGLSGEIMSHDFVEAALMRRAGFHVWLVSDLAGSYEQQPPNLIEELNRDRRWCQGNLQNARLITEPGLHGVHRAMLLTGAFAYLSAPLWFAYVLLGMGLWLFGAHTGAMQGGMLPLEMLGLWAGTVVMLVMPRALGVATIVLKGEQRAYGGTAALVRGALVEGGLSVLLAPIRMIAHSLFVVVALTGLKLDWKSPPREANDVPWSDAARRLGPVAAVILALASAAYAIEPRAVLWLLPVGLPLLLAMPIVVWTSRADLGERIRDWKLLLVPEEIWAPAVLRQAWAYAKQSDGGPTLWNDIVTNPWLFEVVRAAMGPRNTSWGSRGKARRLMVQRVLVAQDAENLPPVDRMHLLSEPQSMVRLRDQLAANATLMPAGWSVREAAQA